jgi:hypothetical protein
MSSAVPLRAILLHLIVGDQRSKMLMRHSGTAATRKMSWSKQRDEKKKKNEGGKKRQQGGNFCIQLEFFVK